MVDTPIFNSKGIKRDDQKENHEKPKKGLTAKEIEFLSKPLIDPITNKEVSGENQSEYDFTATEAYQRAYETFKKINIDISKKEPIRLTREEQKKFLYGP